MKINLKSRMSLISILFYAICFLLCISSVKSQCSLNKNGCDSRFKYMVYVTAVDKNGLPVVGTGKPEYTIVYLFSDRIVFYKSKDQSPMLKDDDMTDPELQMEINIERVIFFGEVILECGGSMNKLCHVGQIPKFEKFTSYGYVKNSFLDAKTQCIIIPFFESVYKDKDQKLAYICEPKTSEIYSLIKFRNLVSRKIERFQFLLSMDRYNGIHGILRKTDKFLTVHKKKVVAVIGKIYNKGIYLLKNDKKQDFIAYYSFFQQRAEKNGAYIVRDIQGTDTLPKDWWAGFEEEPGPDTCCIYFYGDTENMVLCLADKTGTKVESSIDVCNISVKKVFKEITIPMSNIKLYEAYYELLVNTIKRNDCNSAEYNFFKRRLETSADYSIEQDCRNIVQNSSDEMSYKLDTCRKYYIDELELEINQITLSNFEVLKGVRKCVIEKNNLDSKSTLEKKIQKMIKTKTEVAVSFLQVSETFSEMNFMNNNVVNGNMNQLVGMNQMNNGNMNQMANGNMNQMANGNMSQIANGNMDQIANGNMNQMNNVNMNQMANDNMNQMNNGNKNQVNNDNMNQMANDNMNQMNNGNMNQMANSNMNQMNNDNMNQINNGNMNQMNNGNMNQMNDDNMNQMNNGNMNQMTNGNAQISHNDNMNQMNNGNMNQMNDDNMNQMNNGNMNQMTNGNAQISHSLNTGTDVSFTEVKSKTNLQSTIGPIYSKPKETNSPQDLQRYSAYREAQMKKLQTGHTWKTAKRESINDKFDRYAASSGLKNADEFVSFLGYLSDASIKASKIFLANKEDPKQNLD